LIFSFFPGVLLAGINWLVLYLVSLQPPGADETGYAFGMVMLAMLTTLSAIAALGLGIAGTLQRHRKRIFAFLGVACSILVLATIHAWVGLVDLASLATGLLEPHPKAHVVSPGNQSSPPN
jgi:hypothetical protein